MKRYGIRATLPAGDTMRAAHLLGDDFESYRWFDTAEKRDAAYEIMAKQLYNYRKGDVVTQVLEKVEG